MTRPITLGVLGACFVLLVNAVSAGTNLWTNESPPGGDFGGLAIDPMTPNTLYLGASGGGPAL
jgi:hypothetical protein